MHNQEEQQNEKRGENAFWQQWQGRGLRRHCQALQQVSNLERWWQVVVARLQWLTHVGVIRWLTQTYAIIQNNSSKQGNSKHQYKTFSLG